MGLQSISDRLSPIVDAPAAPINSSGAASESVKPQDWLALFPLPVLLLIPR